LIFWLQMAASDAVNLTLLGSNLPNSQLMEGNTRMAFRVSKEDEELFQELFPTVLEGNQWKNFRLKRGADVSSIRRNATTFYCLGERGTEEWTSATNKLIGGDGTIAFSFSVVTFFGVLLGVAVRCCSFDKD
jgi:hypothetical protein